MLSVGLTSELCPSESSYVKHWAQKKQMITTVLGKREFSSETLKISD